MPIVIYKQTAVGQWLQHLCCYSTYKQGLDDEKGANRAQGMKRGHQEVMTDFFSLLRVNHGLVP